MADDTNRPQHPPHPHRDDVDDQIDDVLPVPAKDGQAKPQHVDSSMDTTLPAPGNESFAADDATTREELGVDTTADDIDDFIDPSPARVIDHAPAEPDSHDEVLEIAGEPVVWEPVDDQPGGIETGDTESDPINHDSDFFTASYRADATQSNDASSRPGDPPHYTGLTHQCSACGSAIGPSHFCPQCGTDQYPESRLSALLSPLLAWSRPLMIRSVLCVAVISALIALLANSGASALIISGMAIPVVLVVRLAMQVQGHAMIGWMQIGMMAVVGLVAGLPLAWFAARLVRRSWIETGVLNFGAAGYGGSFAEGAGRAPFLVWLVVGLLLPIVIILGIGAIPAALRMVLNSAARESTGMLLSGAVAAGYVVASCIMFYRPLYSELAPSMTTSQWTLTIFGVAVVRPLVWVLAGAMIGSMGWRYVRTGSPSSIMIPAAIAISLPLGFNVLSLAVAPAGYWPETILGLIIAGLTVFFYHRFLPVALKNDERLFADPVK